jgi:WD40-like Beta Propeller Repeat
MTPLGRSSVVLILLVFAPHAALAAPRTPGDPGVKLELVGEGTVSTDQDEFGAMPDKDWTTLYFNRSIPAHYHYVMYVSQFKNGTWSVPETLPFSGEYRDSDPVISADGRTLYFVSDRPAEGFEANQFHAWSADRTTAGWTNLHPLRGPVNEKGNTEFVSFATNGNLYFTSDRSGSSFDVYRSRLVNAQYQPAENLGPVVNDGRYTIEAFVAPDESFILLGSFARDSLGNADLYITYNENDVWSKPVNFGPSINTKARDYSPRISPDGNYLLFSSERGFPIEPHDQPTSYQEFARRMHGTLNGLGNIYRVPLADALRAAEEQRRQSVPASPVHRPQWSPPL